MRIRQLVIREIFQRNNQLISSLIAVSLGIAVIVGINNISLFSEKAVATELDSLGANVLILPKSASVQDYYSADFQDSELPESYVEVLTQSDLKGIDNLSPKLSMPVVINDKKATLTGILPRNEFKSKAMWQGTLGIFSRPEGCGTVPVIPGLSDSKKSLVRKRVIDDLDRSSLLVGADIAQQLRLSEGDSLDILGNPFKVEAILPQTGTVDDSRLFTHLHTVQKLSGKHSLINVIEVVGCCSAISAGLIGGINKLLPDAKVVTISQIVQTQLNTNTMMQKLSVILLVIILVVGGASIANYMFANVYERRKEIGIFMAMGASSSWIAGMFLLKAAIVGLIGGVLGYISGTILAVILGPKLAGIPVLPVPLLAVYSILISILLSLLASIIPAIKATRVDPVVILQEE
ncbi:MAG: ABC transporter permease [Candidatus Omnitrophota bacterium]